MLRSKLLGQANVWDGTLVITSYSIHYTKLYERIVNAVNFYTSTGGDESVASNRLSEIIKNAIVTEFGKRSVQQAISVERAELSYNFV